MHIKLTNGMRGPKGSIKQVFVKLIDGTGDAWYIIPATEGLHIDDSYIQEDDDVVYNILSVNKGERPPSGYTFIPDHHCYEINVVGTNKEAKSLLDENY
jgi:hypothetical protein